MTKGDKTYKTIIIIKFVMFIVMVNNNLKANDEVNFTNMIKDTYNFKPSTVSDEVRRKKLKDMDKFWNMVISNKEKYLPLLINELKKEGQNSFFYFNGSLLLLKIEPSKSNMEIAINAISKTDINDVDHYYYFKTVHWIACQNVNAYPAIENILNYPNFKTFIFQHALTLAQDYSVIYCLLCMDESLYIDKLIQRLKTEKNETTIKTILLALAYTVTEKAQKAINEFINTSQNEDLKNYAKRYLNLENKNRLPKKEIKSKREQFHRFLDDLVNTKYEEKNYNFDQYYKDAYYLVNKTDYSYIKELRRKKAKTVSDETLSIINFLTMLLQYSYTSTD